MQKILFYEAKCLLLKLGTSEMVKGISNGQVQKKVAVILSVGCVPI